MPVKDLPQAVGSDEEASKAPNALRSTRVTAINRSTAASEVDHWKSGVWELEPSMQDLAQHGVAWPIRRREER